MCYNVFMRKCFTFLWEILWEVYTSRDIYRDLIYYFTKGVSEITITIFVYAAVWDFQITYVFSQ